MQIFADSTGNFYMTYSVASYNHITPNGGSDDYVGFSRLLTRLLYITGWIQLQLRSYFFRVLFVLLMIKETIRLDVH